MFSRNKNHDLDTSLFDPELDLDLIALFSNARTENELQAAASMSRSRMRARRAELKIGSPSRVRRALRSADPR